MNNNKTYLETTLDFFKSKPKNNNSLNNNKSINKLNSKESNNIGIGYKVKSLLEDEFNSLALFVLLVILLLLVYLLYRNTFYKLSESVKSKVQHYKKLSKINPNIEICSQLDITNQYRLCDYYISSSYNTPCIGNPHFDYIDEEMYAKVLNSGARYIQLPISGLSVKYDTEPVVATSERGKNLITSLNTLELRKVLSVIRSNAFKYVKSVNINSDTGEDIIGLASSNYPLIIHLEINTNNVEVMNKAFTDIKDILGRYILSPSKYYNYPISLEKLCKLNNKILLFATGEYETSLLKKIVIPTKYCFRHLTIEDIEDDNKDDLTSTQLNNYFSQNISFINQKNTYKNLEIIRNNLDKILISGIDNPNDNTTSKLLDDLFTNKSNQSNQSNKSNQSNQFKNLAGETDLFTIFNMIGITLIEPMTQNASISINPNPFLAFSLGCQLIPMNFHIIDDIMNTYINIFATSSFILKPSGLRLALNEEQVEDLLTKYGSISLNIDKLNIIPDFIFKLNNEYIILQEQASNDKIMSSLKGGFITFISPKTNNKGLLQDITLNNVFKVVPSPLSNRNDCIMLVNNENLAITLSKDFKISNNQVSLQPIRKTINELKYQTFYPEVGLILEEQGLLQQQQKVKLYVSFRVYNEVLEGLVNDKNTNTSSNTFYLAFEKNKLKVLNKMQDNIKLCSFSYQKVNSKRNIQFRQSIYGGIMVNKLSNVIYYSKKTNLNNAYKFDYINYTGNIKNKLSNNISKSFNSIILRLNNGNLISSKNNSLYVNDNTQNSIEKEHIFYIGKENIKDDDHIIMNYSGMILGVNKNKTIEFMNENNTYLSNSKYFEIKYSFDRFQI